VAKEIDALCAGMKVESQLFNLSLVMLLNFLEDVQKETIYVLNPFCLTLTLIERKAAVVGPSNPKVELSAKSGRSKGRRGGPVSARMNGCIFSVVSHRRMLPAHWGARST
jgi:hypothetical protein